MYVEFKSEAQAERYYTEFQSKTINGQSFVLDFVGDKSKKPEEKCVFRTSLKVDGLDSSVTKEDLKSAFPTARRVKISSNLRSGSGFVLFKTIDLAKAAYENAVNLKLPGRRVTVNYLVGRSNKDRYGLKKRKKPIFTV